MKKIGLKIGVIMLLGVLGISWAGSRVTPVINPNNSLFEMKKNLDIFYDVYGKIEGLYVDEPKPGELMKTGIDAMLKSLDPYTVYIPESKMEDFRFMTTGAYGGIGALIRKHDGKTIIAEPYKDFPADAAGLRAGDVILAIDGESIEGKDQSAISEILKGQPETQLTIKIERPGNSDPMEVVVTRQKVQVPDVPYYGMVDDKTGYVKLNSFTATAHQSVQQAYDELAGKGMEQFVLDLRGNGGGLLIEAVKIVNMFVEKGQEVVTMKGRLQKSNRNYETRSAPTDLNIPVTVLVDENSASASEIVSGALQDLDRAVVVGKRTFGKGLVQQTHDLKYNGKIKITIAKYYTPSGRCIQKIDYSDKDRGEVPDSLLAVFKTKNGREVKDGRGLDPDVKVEPRTVSGITEALIIEQVIFDYATKYRNEHESIAPAGEYRFTDKDFEDFKTFALSRDYKYSNNSIEQLEVLKKVAKEEKYLDEISDQLASLEKTLKPNKSSDLEKNKEELIQVIENEIVSRYYFQSGRIENALIHDNFLKEAIKVLNSRSDYDRILGNS